ncbi:hypothetical protein Hanom_Chr05g00406981 [Helianthus anomalus]
MLFFVICVHLVKLEFVGGEEGVLSSVVSQDLCWSLNPRRFKAN